MNDYVWRPSATQRNVWYYSGPQKRPRIRLCRYSGNGNVYWRAEYHSELIGAVKTPGRDTAELALRTLNHDLMLAASVARDACFDFEDIEEEVSQ